MADFEQDYAWMQQNEDASQAHAVVPDAPPGAHAISGINSAAYPAEFAAIAAIPQAERGPAVEEFYNTHFWNVWEGQLSDQVEERVLDDSVNEGPGTGVRNLQTAINACGGNLTIDGAWGPATVGAANACDQDQLVAEIRNARANHYLAIVAKNPSKRPYLANWLARAQK